MKKSLFTMALVAAGAVIYLLSKDKEEEISETPEIRLIDLKKDNNESESHHDSTEEPQEEEAPGINQEEETEAEPEAEEPVLSQEESFSDLMSELEQELHNESSSDETEEELNEETLQVEQQEEVVEKIVSSEVLEEPVAVEETKIEEATSETVADLEDSAEVKEVEEEKENEQPEIIEEHEKEPVEVAEMKEEEYKSDFSEEVEANSEEESLEDEEETDSVIKDLQGKILNEVEQEIKDNSDFGDFVRGNAQKEEEPRYSGTVYEVSDLYPYLSYEMIDKILDANIGFNHVYHDNQSIKIIHRVGFDKIEDLIEFVILIKEHDYRVEENNGLDMISISKDLVVEDTIIISDIFNVSNQVYRLHGHYQGYEIIEQ